MTRLVLLFLLTQTALRSSAQTCPYSDGVIDFSGSSRSHISLSTFEICDAYYGNTTTLKLSNCGIVSLDIDSFSRFYELSELDLSNNSIVQIDKTTFQPLVGLQVLNLSFNRLTKLEAGLLDLYELKQVYFQHNQITVVEPGIVSDVNENLIYFNLNYNNLTHFDPWPYLVKHTNDRWINRIFDIQHNSISELTNYQNWTFDLVYPFQVEVNMQYNKLKSLTFDNIRQYFTEYQTDDSIFPAYLTFYLNITNNPYICDCNLYQFADVVRSGVLRWSRVDEYRFRCNASGIDWLHDIELDQLVCPLGSTDKCPSGCFCEDRPHNDTLFIDCRNGGLVQMPDQIPETDRNNIEMFLDNNHIRTLKNVSYISMISILLLSNNQIDSLDSNIIKSMVNVQYLDLSQNSIQDIPKEIQRFPYSSVNLAKNPLKCGCASLWLSGWIKLDQENSDTSLTCDSDAGTHAIISLTLSEMNCTNKNLIIMLVGVGVGVLILAVVGIFVKRCPYQTKVIIFKLLRFHPADKYKVDKNKSKEIDIYLSFDDEDADVRGWVRMFHKKLNSKKPIYSVLNPCRFTEADAQSESIMKWVTKARRIIVVLSEKFFDNEWRVFETDNAERNLVEAETRNVTDNFENESVVNNANDVPGAAGKIIYIVYNSNENLLKKLEEEPWKTRLAGKVVLKESEKMFWSKLRYELPLQGNGIGDGNLVAKMLRDHVDNAQTGLTYPRRDAIAKPPTKCGNRITSVAGSSADRRPLKSRGAESVILEIHDETKPNSQLKSVRNPKPTSCSQYDGRPMVHRNKSQINSPNTSQLESFRTTPLNAPQLLKDQRVVHVGANGFSRYLQLGGIIRETMRGQDT